MSTDTSEPADIEQLIADARHGVAALSRLMSVSRDKLRAERDGQILGALAPKADVSDLVQETFLSASKHFPDFRGSTAKEWWAWLNQIADHRKIDIHRKYTAGRRATQLERPFDDSSDLAADGAVAGDPSPSSALINREEAETLLAAVRRLPPDQQKVVLLREWYSVPFRDIGLVMDRSDDAAKQLHKRAIEALRSDSTVQQRGGYDVAAC